MDTPVKDEARAREDRRRKNERIDLVRRLTALLGKAHADDWGLIHDLTDLLDPRDVTSADTTSSLGFAPYQGQPPSECVAITFFRHHGPWTLEVNAMADVYLDQYAADECVEATALVRGNTRTPLLSTSVLLTDAEESEFQEAIAEARLRLKLDDAERKGGCDR